MGFCCDAKNMKNKRTDKLEWWCLMQRSRNLKLRPWLLSFFRQARWAKDKRKSWLLSGNVTSLWYTSRAQTLSFAWNHGLVFFFIHSSGQIFIRNLYRTNHSIDISNANKSLHNIALYAKWIECPYWNWAHFHAFCQCFESPFKWKRMCVINYD